MRKLSDVEKDENFKAIIISALKILSFNDLDLARLLKVNRSTVTRWKDGVSVPCNGLRDPLVKIIKKEIKNRSKK